MPASASPRIAIVVTFLGPAPLWLPAFLCSCRRNPAVQWLIYADFTADMPLPDNVSITPFDLDEFNRRASDATERPIEITPGSMRKMCDLKPAYGLMFADALREFDWWAYSDLDIIWGDIRRFVTDEMLETCNIISSRQRKLAGHCALFRNTDAVNRMFLAIPQLDAELANPLCRRIDEHLFTNYLRDLIATSSFKARPPIYWKQEMTITAAYQKALPEGDAGALWWKDGRTFDAEGQELMYLHFHKLKAGLRSIDFAAGECPDSFAITRDGIYRDPQGRPFLSPRNCEGVA